MKALRKIASVLCFLSAAVGLEAAQGIKDLTLGGTTTDASTYNASGAHTFLSGASETFASGSSATFASGSTLTVAGSFVVPATLTRGAFTITWPGATTTLVGRDTTDTLTNKSIDAGQLTGTIAAGRMPAFTGDITTSAGSVATTLATVNSNVGSFGSATQSLTATVDAKGRITALSAQTVTPAVDSITGLGTGVSAFLATPSSANLATAATDETGSGALVFATSPTLVTPVLGVASSTSESITGTGGNGFVDLPAQSADPTAPASNHIRIFANSANKFAWIGASGYVRNFDGTLSASRTYTLPDANSSIPVFGQTITFSGPTAARTVTLPDANFTVARTDAGQTFTGTQAFGAITATSVTNSGLTSGRVPIASTGGLMADDSDMTFATDTLTVTKATIGGISHIANAITSANSITAASTTDFTAQAGSSGASLLLKQGVAGGFITLTPTGTGKVNVMGPLALNDGSYLTGVASVAQFLTSADAALPVKVGSLVVSNSYSNSAPTNGIYSTGAVQIASTTASTSTTTGSLINAGGFGNAGKGYFGDDVTVTLGGFFGTTTAAITQTGTAGAQFTARTTSASGYAEFVVRNSSNTNMGVFGYGNASAAAPFTDVVYFQAASKPMVFFQGSTEVARLTTAGALSILSNLTVSGTGTSTMASNFTLAGIFANDTSSASPGSLSATGYRMYPNTTSGLTLYGRGSTNDVTIGNRSNSDAIQIPANTVNVVFPSTTSGTSTTAAAILGKSMGLTENLYVGGTGNFTGNVTVGSSTVQANGSILNVFTRTTAANTGTWDATNPAASNTELEFVRTGGAATGRNITMKFGDGSSVVGYFGIVQNAGGRADYVWDQYGTDNVYAERMRLSSDGNLTVSGVHIVSTDTRSGAGAVSVTKDTTKLTSTGGAEAITLADGVDGQIKRIVHDVDGGSMVLTPTTKTGFSTVTFTNAGDTVTLEFVTTRGWMVVGSYGVTIAP